MSDSNLPVDQPSFWKKRLTEARQSPSEIHKALWNTDLDTWNKMQESHKKLLYRLMGDRSRVRVLDAGCGMGDLVPCLPPGIRYTGIDVSPDFIMEARNRYQNHDFVVGDLRQLPYESRSFDYVVARSIEGMILSNKGVAVWHQIEEELLRVGDRLVILGYTSQDIGKVTDAVSNPEEFRCTTISCENGYLVYRPGKDSTVELYDLMVYPDRRRVGYGTQLVERLLKEPFHMVYGFTRVDNAAALSFYKKMGFALEHVPYFYRAMDAMMFTRETTKPYINADPLL